MGLADSAFRSPEPLLHLFFVSTWVASSFYLYKRSSKLECHSTLFLQRRLLLVIGSNLPVTDEPLMMIELIINSSYTAVYLLRS